MLAPEAHRVGEVEVILVAGHGLVLGGRLLLRGDSVPETELHIAGRACDERVCVAAVVNLARAALWVGAAGEVGNFLDGLVNEVGKISSRCMLLVRG